MSVAKQDNIVGKSVLGPFENSQNDHNLSAVKSDADDPARRKQKSFTAKYESTNIIVGQKRGRPRQRAMG